jgi:hypothetical protein
MAGSLMVAFALSGVAAPAFADPVPGVVVSPNADIFAAGLTSVPDFPGGGGSLPSKVDVGTAKTVTVMAEGSVDCGAGSPVGPDGSTGGGIVAIQSTGGIAGADIPGGPSCGLALAGVFTGSAAPAAPPPSRLDFSGPGATAFTSLSPAAGQTFYVGDGLTGTGTGDRQQFQVPAGATTLWLGFQDGQTYTSPPGYYGDNTGRIDVTVELAGTTPSGRIIAAGYFNGVVASPSAPKPKKAGSNDGICTAGFSVTNGQTRYVLTANHCREWLNAKTGKQMGEYANPVNIVSDNDLGRRVTWASNLDCDRGSPRCLRPGRNKSPNDILAWAPDPGTVTPAGFAFTGYGLLPVLGSADWSKGQTVCRFGITTNHEQCGAIEKFDSDSGYVRMTDFDSDHAHEGDSGGPVYAYVRSATGVPIGVRAIGITEGYDDKGRTYFMPIATVLKFLNVSVLTVP